VREKVDKKRLRVAVAQKRREGPIRKGGGEGGHSEGGEFWEGGKGRAVTKAFSASREEEGEEQSLGGGRRSPLREGGNAIGGVNEIEKAAAKRGEICLYLKRGGETGRKPCMGRVRDQK